MILFVALIDVCGCLVVIDFGAIESVVCLRLFGVYDGGLHVGFLVAVG